MPPKKILILAMTFSLIGHAFIFSAAGFFAARRSGGKNDTIITVELQQTVKTQAAEEKKAPQAGKAPALPLEKASDSDPPAKETKDVAPREVTISLNSLDEKFAPYLKTIKKKIEFIWSAAGQDGEPGRGGISTVMFSIDSTGALRASRIVSSCGDQTLDWETLQVIKAAAPYAPFPRDFNLSLLKITADFIYGPLPEKSTAAIRRTRRQ